MPVRYGRFEMPKTLAKDESTATDTYAKFTAEPFEAGYGHTVGNSLRRVLLSSLEGAAITAAKITGAQHEFATLPGVVEDVTDIVLNLKKVKFKLEGQDHEPKKLSLTVNKEGEVTAGDIQAIQGVESANHLLRVQHLETLDGLDVAGGHFAFLVHGERKFLRLVVLSFEFEFHFLEVEDDVGNILDHTRERGELMLRARDFCRGDGRAFQRRKQNAPDGVPNGVTVTGLKRLGGEFCIGIS